MGVEGVGQCEGDTRGTHQHVREGQVSNEKVGDVVHLARAANDVEEQVVAEDTHQSHQGIAGNDERLERLQQLYTHKLGAALGGAIMQGHLKDLTSVAHVPVKHLLLSRPAAQLLAALSIPKGLRQPGGVKSSLLGMYRTSCLYLCI